MWQRTSALAIVAGCLLLLLPDAAGVLTAASYDGGVAEMDVMSASDIIDVGSKTVNMCILQITNCYMKTEYA